MYRFAALLLLLLPLSTGCRGYDVESESAPNAAPLMLATTFRSQPLTVSFNPAVWDDPPDAEDWQETVDDWTEAYRLELSDTPGGLLVLQLPADGSVAEGILVDADVPLVEHSFPDHHATLRVTFIDIATNAVLYTAQMRAEASSGFTFTQRVRSAIKKLVGGIHQAMETGSVQ